MPVLWDKRLGTIVNNESADIVRMLNSGFGDLASGPDLYPAALRPEIDALNATIYPRLNNGVYRAGFATTQEAYDEAFADVFAELDADRRRRLAERIDGAEQVLITAAVAGDDCGAQQRLAFPDFAPFAVVALVAGDGAHHRAGPPLGAQSKVDFERRVGAGCAQPCSDLFCHGYRPLHRDRFLHARMGFADEHHVGVGAVAEFTSAEAAHPDDGDPRRRTALGCIRPDDRVQRCLQHRDPHHGELLAHRGHVQHAQKIG